MPALSYKKQFVSAVVGGLKPHSIRAWRKRPFQPGDVLMHYTAMRTKQCRKIRPDTICTAAVAIVINQQPRSVCLAGKSYYYGSGQLSDAQIHDLALCDGFASLDEFFSFFAEHGPLFSGQLIEWNPFAPAPVPARENGEPVDQARTPICPVSAAAEKPEPRDRRITAPVAVPPRRDEETRPLYCPY